MNASAKPRIRPPAIAPGIEPIPPITAAVKPFSPARKPIATSVGARSANITPAAPASAEPSTNANTITRSTSMPIIEAASRSCEVARIALPMRVLVTSSHSTIISANAERTITIRSSGTRTLPMLKPLKKSAPLGEREGVVVALLGAEHHLHRVREEERDAERADQRRDPRGVAERPIGEALDHDAEHRAAGHGRKRDQHQQQPGRHHRIRRAPQQLERAEADERADHEHIAVGEVEELQDPVDERVAERDQGIDAAQREPVDRELDEGVHRCRVSLFLCRRAARRNRRAARCLA